jgi:hypothetical protein
VHRRPDLLACHSFSLLAEDATQARLGLLFFFLSPPAAPRLIKQLQATPSLPRLPLVCESWPVPAWVRQSGLADYRTELTGIGTGTGTGTGTFYLTQSLAHFAGPESGRQGQHQAEHVVRDRLNLAVNQSQHSNMSPSTIWPRQAPLDAVFQKLAEVAEIC